MSSVWRRVSISLIVTFLLYLGTAFAAAGSRFLSTLGIKADIDPASGRLVAILNRSTGVSYRLIADSTVVATEEHTIDLSRIPVRQAASTRRSCSFIGDASGLEFDWKYSFPDGRDYFERELAIKNVTAHSVLIKSVSDCQLRFATPFQSVVFHDDNMDMGDARSERYSETEKPSFYHTSINVFLQEASGGLCAGLKYPYFKPEMTNDGVAFTYETNYRLNPGQRLQLPTMFCAAYQSLGYTCRKELNWRPRIISTNQETMDWGQVRAMQQVMRDHLPEPQVPWRGYGIWLNSWWANPNLRKQMGSTQAEAFCRLADRVKESRCIDLVSTAPVWCGWTGFIDPCKEIDAIGDAAVFPRNPAINHAMAYVHSIGLPVSGFCEPNSLNRHYRQDRPAWKLQPRPDSTNTLVQNCHANEQYEDWFYRLTASTIDSCQLSGWAWDHSWVRRPMLCYGTTHGHEPGNCEFQQHLNVTGLIAKLRQRYPRLFMEIYWGLKEAGPWSLQGLNSLENAYENNSPAPPGMTAADDLRFQHWFNHNYRFIPTYLNMAQINFHKETNGHLYSLLSCLSASTHASLCDWVPFDSEAQADEIFRLMRLWKPWASRNLRYLSDRVDLFGQPCRKEGIDGTAHILGDQGFLFVFNPTPDAHWGSIPLTRLIGLTKGSKFALDEISTGHPKRLGVYERGEDLVFPIAAKSALLIELKPTRAKPKRITVPSGTPIQPAFGN